MLPTNWLAIELCISHGTVWRGIPNVFLVMNLVIDNEFIGDMLIYNSGFSRTSYTYKGIPSIMYQQMEVSYVLNIRNVLWSTHLSLKMNTFPTNRNWISQPLKNLKETKKKSMDIG